MYCFPFERNCGAEVQLFAQICVHKLQYHERKQQQTTLRRQFGLA
jgi:hypothetical protein